MPIQSAQSLSSDMNAVPRGARSLPETRLTPQSRSRRGSGCWKGRQMERGKAENSSLTPSIRLQGLQPPSHAASVSFCLKVTFSEKKVLTCFYVSKQNLPLNFRISILPISMKKTVLEAQNKDSGCFGPIFPPACFERDCPAVGRDLRRWVSKWFRKAAGNH